MPVRESHPAKPLNLQSTDVDVKQSEHGENRERCEGRDRIYQTFLSLFIGILKCFADKTIDDDDNDVYETIEFSDSSSHVYTEPVRDYGVLRKVNIKTSLRQRASRKPPSGLKKSAGSRNLQKFSAMQNLQVVENEENEPKVELRSKPETVNDPENNLISVGLRNHARH